ncbi:MAG: tryptophanase [bacterium]|nr:tryptophanase [bacterium]
MEKDYFIERKPMPFRIKTVEHVKMTTKAEREKLIAEAYYNVFNLKARDVYIDLLTDSGTGAMSKEQWAAIMMGDESYAGADSFLKFKQAINDVLGFDFVLPTHQGRGAENVFTKAFVKEGDIIPGNMHFDTTEAQIEDKKGIGKEFVIDEAYDPQLIHPFKGNVNISKLEQFLQKNRDKVPLFILTVTCNSGGGQPVSMRNIKELSAVLKKFEVPLFFDIARFAENAYFIKHRESGYENKTISEIILEMMSYADVVSCSAKKDPLGNIGGFLAMRTEDYFDKLKPFVILNEGFITYGGLSGRALEALAVGLHESTSEEHLAYRISQVHYLGKLLDDAGIPIVKPVGGHGVFVDGLKFFPHIPQDNFPSQALTVYLYIESGVRGVEIGNLLAGRDPQTGKNRYPKVDTLRLAIPRRVYTNEHMEYVAEGLKKIYKDREKYKGFEMVYEPPFLRHFSAKLKKVE